MKATDLVQLPPDLAFWCLPPVVGEMLRQDVKRGTHPDHIYRAFKDSLPSRPACLSVVQCVIAVRYLGTVYQYQQQKGLL